VTLRVAMAGDLAGVRRADVACKIMPNKLRLALDKGAPALEGTLEDGVMDAGSFWQFEELPGVGRVLSVVLEKKMGMAPWVRGGGGSSARAVVTQRRCVLTRLVLLHRARSICLTRTS
jgi:hypothetical protein